MAGKKISIARPIPLDSAGSTTYYMGVKGGQTMTIREMQVVLGAAGAEVRLVGTRLYIRSTPCGGAGDYGYLVDGDDGSTGSCDGVTRRRGEIAAILRGER